MAIIQNNEKGFTLVELLVSVLIFAIGVAALTQTLMATIRGNNLGNRETIAVTIANAKMDELRGVDPSLFYNDTRLLPGTKDTTTQPKNVIPNILGGTTPVNSPQGYHVSYFVTDLPNSSGSLFYQNAKQIDVTVSWADPASHSVTVSSVLVPNI